MAAIKKPSPQSAQNPNETPEERKRRILSKFKNLLLIQTRKQTAAQRKAKLQALIKRKRAEQGIDLKEEKNDSPYVPCSDNCIKKFIELTSPISSDIIVDIGCGDARLLIQAAKYANCKCIGIEIQPQIVRKARQSVSDNNLNHLIQIIECDFKSKKCINLFKNATIIFLFLLPSIMPLITDILINNINNKCRVVSYIFDLCRVKSANSEIKTFNINNDWRYPSFGSTKLYKNQNKIYLINIHPEFKRMYNININNIKYCNLRKINGKYIDNIRTEYDLIVFRRYLDNLIRDYHIHRFNNRNVGCDDDKYNLKIEFEYEEYEINDNDDNKNETEILKPNLLIEVSKKFKNGSEMRSDLKLYQFPINKNDFGWTNPNGPYRLIHAIKK